MSGTIPSMEVDTNELKDNTVIVGMPDGLVVIYHSLILPSSPWCFWRSGKEKGGCHRRAPACTVSDPALLDLSCIVRTLQMGLSS